MLRICFVLLGASAATAALLGVCGCGGRVVHQARVPESLPVSGWAEKTRTTDALHYGVAARIAAPREIVWRILVDAKGYPSWSSTVKSLDGTIEARGKVTLVTTDLPDRPFALTVTTFEPPQQLVWQSGDASFTGVRIFTLMPADDGGTTFTMGETFSGSMLGFIEGSLPDMKPQFETFASELKRTAEAEAHKAAAPPPADDAPAVAPAPTPEPTPAPAPPAAKKPAAKKKKKKKP